MQVDKVSRKILDENGIIVVNYSDNPMLNTLMYDVDLPDGAINPYDANMIPENIHSAVN